MFHTLIATDALAAHLGDHWAIVDCRYDLQNEPWGHAQYQIAHIPSAVYASLGEDLAGPRTGANGRHPIPSVAELADTFGRLGISRNVQVVAYDQDSGMFASRLWWLLRYLGHDAVAVLDGGWAKWTGERRPIAGGDSGRAVATFAPSPRGGMRLDVGEVAAHLGDETLLLVDARGPERFEGRTEPIDRAAGHIPGALNHYFRDNLTDSGTMRPPDELRRVFTELLDGRDPATAVMYCGSGVSACHNLLAMEHAGIPGARLYPGSWSEWSADPGRPVEKGPATP